MVVPQRLADAPTLVMALAGDLFKLRYKGMQSFRRVRSCRYDRRTRPDDISSGCAPPLPPPDGLTQASVRPLGVHARRLQLRMAQVPRRRFQIARFGV